MAAHGPLDADNKVTILTLHFPWNGDTRAQKWRVVTGQSDDSVTEVFAEVDKEQYEHWVDIPEGVSKCQYFRAMAFDDQDEEFNRSRGWPRQPARHRCSRMLLRLCLAVFGEVVAGWPSLRRLGTGSSRFVRQ
mmetsp:Transcript_36298/g.104125  ORF Transcript_36298/g.104125 Transcript_36298/m.104125 type:complete len:133 (-) Transcript_36298:15-413(-)